ncbi:coiled-coil domain-containing protein 13 [Pelobates fuscus]|uniref:coiled-coil domain-containing protein 13 n=1 Tax=Pelobates fuscus TaxID=191477 RepID=UPI002FE4D45A
MVTMNSDETVNENLRLQFKALQEQQQKRLQRLMERKREKELRQSQKDENQKSTFGIEDDLNLIKKGDSSLSDISKRLLEDENEQLQNQLRETKDENGRLHKLLKEKEFEIKHLRKKMEESKLALAGTAGMAGDVAATKIVELSKKNRELTAEMESEKTKVKQLNNKLKETEKELQNMTGRLQCSPGKDSGNGQPVLRTVEQNKIENSEIKVLQEKLSTANMKLTEYRNQIQSLKQELKMVHKVLVNEIGDDVNIPQLMASAGTWRGRSQQILALQGRVRELENQLGQGRSPGSGLSLEEEMLGISASKRYGAQEKNLYRLRVVEKDKKETLEKVTGEHEALKKDHEDLKKKLDASKARNKVLSNDVRSLKMQIATLVEKGKHDDELVDALLSQQKSMQEVLHRLSQQDQKDKQSTEMLASQLNSETQKQNSLVAQLKAMVAEREAKVKQLEDEVKQLTLTMHLDKPHSGRSSDGQKSGDVTSARSSASARSLSDFRARHGSGSRAISNMGHELVDSAATKPDNAVSARSSSEFHALQTQVTQFRALCQAAEVERDRLMELVSVLQRRVEESTQKALQAEKKLQEERRRSVLLEQQLEKMRIDMSKNTPTRGKMGQSLTSSRHLLNFSERTDQSYTQTSEVPLETQIEELNTKVAIQLDENEALKTALKETLKTKGEDLKLYHEMIGEVKQIFLQALRQHKQDRGLSSD